MNSAEIFESMKTLISEINITCSKEAVREGSKPEDPKYIFDERSKLFSPFGNIKTPSYLRVANDGEEWEMTQVYFNGFLITDFIKTYEDIDKAFDEAFARDAEFVKIGIRPVSILPSYIDFIKTKYSGLRFDNESSRYVCDFAKVQIEVIDHFCEKHIYNFYYVLRRLLEGSLERLAKNTEPTFISNLKWNSTDVNLIELVAALIAKQAIVGKDRDLKKEDIFNQFQTILNIEIKDLDSKLSKAKRRTREKAPFLLSLTDTFRSLKPDKRKNNQSS
ncbi:MAG TPA: RteC domain-containing protein [Bacteroidales bacterium]|nr:RteC domain-containing protein [Bacteroidales bacterium]